jgi:hypothetical protein
MNKGEEWIFKTAKYATLDDVSSVFFRGKDSGLTRRKFFDKAGA